METTFTICFESPFWVGVLERHDEEGYWVGRHVFGPEPSHAEVWEFAKTDFARLRVTLVRPGETEPAAAKPKSIKKSQRDAKRDQARGFSVYTHDALQVQFQLLKQERRTESRAARDQRERELFEKRQQKKKEKLRGH